MLRPSGLLATREGCTSVEELETVEYSKRKAFDRSI
jgi:hypothetical protein